MDDRITMVAVVGIVVIGLACVGGTITAQFLGKEPAAIYGTAIVAIISYIGGMLSTFGKSRSTNNSAASGS